ncbi:MAG: hypothetical protein PHD04_04255 [Candidatus Pacebacteria bacterium]|nr:hypothetical protein [Candidatus Paceibacterota bacterium]
MATKKQPDKLIKLYGGKVLIEFYESSHRYMVSVLKGKTWSDSERAQGVTTFTHVIDKSQALLYWASNLTMTHLITIIEDGGKIRIKDIQEAVVKYRERKDEAADLGKEVHALAEGYINAKMAGKKEPHVNPAEYDDRVFRGYLAFLDWVKQHGVKFVASEEPINSLKYKYVGTLDVIFTLAAEKHKIVHIGDFKTGKYREIKKQVDGRWKVVGVTAYPEHRMQVSGYQAAKEEETGKKYGSKWIMYFSKDDGSFTAFEIPASEHKGDFDAFLGCVVIKRRLDALN